MFHSIRALQHEPGGPMSNLVPEDALAYAYGSYLVACSSMAASAWLFWDVLITMQDEIDIVWHVRWSFVRILYHFMRYSGVLLQAISLWFSRNTHGTGCLLWTIFRAVVTYFLTLALDYIMLLRVCALYSRHRLLRRLIRGTFYIVMTTSFISLATFLPTITFDPTCSFAISSHPGVYIYGAVFTIFQVLLFLCTLGQFFRAVKVGWSSTPIINLLARDGTWSFFILMAFASIYLFVLSFAHPSLHNLLFNWVISIYSFIGYRNLSNIFQLSLQSRMVTISARSPDMLSTNPTEALTCDEYEREMGLSTRDD